jgi:hypothetical protein
VEQEEQVQEVNPDVAPVDPRFVLPQEFSDPRFIAQLKKQWGRVSKVHLSSGIFVIRPLMWADLREVTKKLENLQKSPNADKANFPMLEMAFMLEFASIYPKIEAATIDAIPAGDVETLHNVVNEISGYVNMAPVVEDF